LSGLRGASQSNDVIGYYVYKNNAKVGVIRDQGSRSFSMGSGSYFVRAVDITGKLSNPSNTIGAEEVIVDTPPEPVIPDKPDSPKDETLAPPSTAEPSTPGSSTPPAPSSGDESPDEPPVEVEDIIPPENGNSNNVKP